MTKTEINEADQTHQSVKQALIEIAEDETLTAAQRDNARTALGRLGSLELALTEMLARGESLCLPTK